MYVPSCGSTRPCPSRCGRRRTSERCATTVGSTTRASCMSSTRRLSCSCSCAADSAIFMRSRCTASARPELSRVRSDLEWALRALGPAAELVREKLIQNNGHVVLHAVEIENRGVRRRLILRRYIDLEWLRLEPDLAEREAKVLQLLERSTDLATPKLVAVDPVGK